MNWPREASTRDDVHEAGEAVGGVHFDLNDGAFEADDGAGIDFGKHGAKCSRVKRGGQVQPRIIMPAMARAGIDLEMRTRFTQP
jgi:hypothetical protein